MGRTATMQLRWFILLSEMPLEYSHDHSRKSNQKLGFGATSSIPRLGAISSAPGRTFFNTIGKVESKTIYIDSGLIACEGEIQL